MRPLRPLLLLSLLCAWSHGCNPDQQPASPAANDAADAELCRADVRSVVQSCGSAHLEFGPTVAAQECQAELEHEHGGRWQVAASPCGFAYRVRHSSQLCLVSFATDSGRDVYMLAWAD